MKITTTNIKNENYIQIFLLKEELNKPEIESQIKSLKKIGNKVSIFISGNEDLFQIIKKNIFYTFDNT